MIDDDAEYEARRQIRAQADADVASFISSLDQDETTGVPPPPVIKVSEVASNPIELDFIGFGPQGSETTPVPGQPPPQVPWACCKPDESCEMLSKAACDEAGGTWHVGQTCDEDPCPADCSTCDDLPPTNPLGPPVHINIQITMSGACDDLEFSGTITYDHDLTFHPEGPVSGHNFCADDIASAWSGHFTERCALSGATMDFGGSGPAGILLGREVSDCTWWMVCPSFSGSGAFSSCSGCTWLVTPLPFQMIAGAGDPSGTYNFSDTNAGVTVSIAVTIS